jgi:hypothetical protein
MNDMQNHHQAVHWIDGMKLSSDHFLQSDAHHSEQLRSAVELLLDDFNYGLLPAPGGERSPLEYDLDPHPDRFEFALRSCHAVTRGGLHIRIAQGDDNAERHKASVKASDYEMQQDLKLSVVLSYNPFKRIPVGQPDPEESPLRHPFTVPTSRLEIVPESMLNLNYARSQYLVIGRVVWRERRFFWMEDYIPPCRSSAAHPMLREKYATMDNHLNHLQTHSEAILEGIYKEEALNRPEFDKQLAGNTGRLCGAMLRIIADSTFFFKNQVLHGPPILLVQQVSRLAAGLRAALQMIPPKEEQRLLQYYNNWTKIEASDFQSTLSKIADLKYSHLDIMASLGPAERFLAFITGLWKRLSQLKFIGQDDHNLVLGIEDEYSARRTESNILID